jgi:uncharacterized protein
MEDLPMPQMIFVNLPVTDLPRARAFYQGLGFTINEQFSDDTAACVVVSDTIYLMILTRAKFASFSTLPVADPKTTCGTLIALSQDDKTAVDRMVAAALSHGGSEPRPVADLGFMYQRTIADPDGNTFEPFWMDPAAITS